MYSTSNSDNIELQGKLLNKLVIQNNERLLEAEVNNKLSYLLYINNEMVINEMKKINSICKIIDSSIEAKNYKRAFKFCCYLNNVTNNLLNKI